MEPSGNPIILAGCGLRHTDVVQQLGRAKDISEFVKHGCQEAMIEIELAGDGKRYKRNPIIQCSIKREGNKSHFSINGKPSSKKGVLDLAKSFSIQIDNLCQFLPQDKVVEFAAMTPVELLRSTQRAVAPQEMLDMHDSLKELRRHQKELQSSQISDQDTLTNLEGRQRMQEADVERMREREAIKDRVKMMEASKPFAEYRGARLKHKEAKDKRKVAADELKNLEDEIAPSLQAVNAKQLYRQQIETVVNERTRMMKMSEQAADGIDRKLNNLHDRTVEFGNAKDAERKGSQETRKEIARLDGVIRGLKKQMEETPPDLDVSSYNERIVGVSPCNGPIYLANKLQREKSRLIDENIREITELKRTQEGLATRGRQKSARIQQAKSDLEDLESQAGQQNSKLAQISRDTSRAWEWIQQHQNEFEKTIYGPPIVECAVTDPRYVDLVETLFQKNNLLSFTVQTNNDFKKLSDELHGHLKLSEVNIRTMTGRLDEFRPTIDPEETKRYGFEGWALDYLTGPEPVLASLCYDIRLHLTAISLRDTTSQQYELLQNSPIESWVTSKSSYKIVRRREYGPSATSTQVRDVRKARIWTDQPVDLRVKRELQENIEGWGEEVKSYKREIEESQAKIVRLRGEKHQNEEDQATLQRDKATKQKILGEFKALPTKLSQNEDKLATAQELLTGTRQRVQDISDQHDAATFESVQAALDYADAVENLRNAHNTLHEAELMLIEATSDLEILISRNSDVKALLEAKQSEVNELARQTDAAQEEARAVLRKCRALLANPDVALQEFWKALPEGQTLEQLENEIDSEKARLELMHEGNGGVIKEFEQRQKRIDALKAKLEEFKHGLDEFDEKIREIRNKWEPELDKLVKRISDSFSFNMKQINCAGEVGIFKDEQDFDQWAILIQVKFRYVSCFFTALLSQPTDPCILRESEPLTTLDSHRQSGGERAVSTIFYLMSLQALTRSPFRVVDEINQGMDPRNERLVHKRMVAIACGSDEASAQGLENEVNGEGQAADEERGNGGSQYFLITPKLLHGLAYARGMQVLCIASGEYMPADRTRVDFRGCVDLMRGLRMGARVGVVG